MTMKHPRLYNVIADNWTNGKYCLGCHVYSRREAAKWAAEYRRKYENKPYPNGKGWFDCKNFRVVEITEEEEEFIPCG